MRSPCELAFAFTCVLDLAGLTLTGCHHKRHGGPSPFEQSCTQTCQRVASCDESVDVAACDDACINSISTFGGHLRKQYFDEFNACIADARCSDLGVTANDNDCRKNATKRIGVNLKTIALCDALSEMLERCGSVTAPDPKPCQQSMKIFDDAMLDHATDCSGESCTDISKCFVESLGVVPGPMAIPSDSDSQD
jgi:hypothetical protein